MLVHFIGGPAHGRSEAIQNPQPVYRMAQLKPMPSFATLDFPPAEVPFEEHEYRITRRTRRYCIAEWQPPKVDVQVSVAFTGLSFWDRDVAEKLHRFVAEERTDCASIRGRQLTLERDHYGTGVLTLEWAAKVDDPADPEAIAEATELVQNRIDAGVGFLPDRFSTIAAQVKSD